LQEKITDWRAITISIAGLIIACIAIAVPYFQSINNAHELLKITAKYELYDGDVKLTDDVITFSEKPINVNAVLIPWIITLSNAGDKKVSILDYVVESNTIIDHDYMIVGGGISALDNGIVNFPIIIDSGESVRFRIHVGFSPSDKVQEILEKITAEKGELNAKDVGFELGKAGTTIFGDEAISKNGVGILSHKKNIPVNWIIFKTGRGNEFQVEIPDSMENLPF
jgi:hypothetical protein